MQEITYEVAVNIFLNENKEVYLMYDDGTESLVENQLELFNHHQDGGKFGIEV